MSNPFTNALPLTWERDDRGDLVADVHADNVILCTLTVYPAGTGSFGNGHMFWLEGKELGAGRDSATEVEAKRDAIEMAIQALDAARETLVAARDAA